MGAKSPDSITCSGGCGGGTSTSQASILSSVLGSSADCTNNPSSSITYFYRCMGMMELGVDFGLLLSTLLWVIAPVTMALIGSYFLSYTNEVIATLVTAAWFGNMFILMYEFFNNFINGASLTTLGAELLGFIWSTFNFLSYLYPYMPGWIQLLFWGSIGTDEGVDAAEVSTTAIIAPVVVALGAAIYEVSWFFTDISDSNDIAYGG